MLKVIETTCKVSTLKLFSNSSSLNDDLFKDKHMSDNLMYKLMCLSKLDLPIGSDTYVSSTNKKFWLRVPSLVPVGNSGKAKKYGLENRGSARLKMVIPKTPMKGSAIQVTNNLHPTQSKFSNDDYYGFPFSPLTEISRI